MEKTTAELYAEEVAFRKNFDMEKARIDAARYQSDVERLERAVKAEERTANALERIVTLLAIFVETEGR